MKNLLGLILLLISIFSHSAEIQSIKVFGEDIKNCGLSSSSADGAISAALRYNRVNISQNSMLSAYHSIIALDSGSGCSVAVKFQIYNFGRSYIPGLNRSDEIFLDKVLCDRINILTGPQYDMQSRVNDVLKSFVDYCINDISKK